METNQPKKIKVTITGDYNAGKSTVGYLLAHVLQERKIPVHFQDPEARHPRPSEDQEMALSQIHDRALWERSHGHPNHVTVEIVEIHGLPRTLEQRATEALGQRDQLIRQVDKFLRQAGVLSDTAAPLSGPEALSQLEIYGEHLAKHELKEGWFLPKESLNSLQHDSVSMVTQRARGAHMTDIDMRINGQNERFQADWLKHMVSAHGFVEKKTPPSTDS